MKDRGQRSCVKYCISISINLFQFAYVISYKKSILEFIDLLIKHVYYFPWIRHCHQIKLYKKYSAESNGKANNKKYYVFSFATTKTFHTLVKGSKPQTCIFRKDVIYRLHDTGWLSSVFCPAENTWEMFAGVHSEEAIALLYSDYIVYLQFAIYR